MKTLRLFVLVVFAALLPVRGAMAAALLCPAAGGPTSHAVHAAEVDAADEAATPMDMDADDGAADGAGPMQHAAAADAASHGDHAQHAAAAGEDNRGDHGDHTTCTLCCDLCAMSALPAAPPSLPEQEPARTAVFAAPPAPATSFLLDGQDRPPRRS